ncbi:ABC transporter permease [Natronobiforma cellulositropha]|uniref:ABC transporter permease n=1 Tax=Natronobiforma cellulositropha TaxID=1679076 RepID=UPI0021D5CB23|nr:ABC transporter permease [Natronobiforma cellulositropha]
MNLPESLRISWRSIASHKLRSTLTTLGVIIGVASVITFMVLGGAFTASIVGDLESFDEPGMLVWTQTTPADGFGVIEVDAAIYTEHDVERLEALDGVSSVSPTASIPVTQTAHGGDRVTGTVGVTATTDGYFLPEEIVDGEAFTAGANEAMINAHAAQLFDGGVGVGDELTLSLPDGSSETVTVVGVVEEADGFGSSPMLYVPTDPFYTTTIETPRETTEHAYSSLVVVAEGPESVDGVQTAILEYFESDEADASQLKQGDHEIAVQTVDDAIEQVTEIVDQLTILIAGIAAIALVVGSIGIANIMIVSVTERTREIGIMKAVGATNRDILQLFLVESVILGFIGSVFGVLLGLGVGFLGVSLLEWPMVYPLDWIAIAIAVGVGVGVLSGLYPAWQAAKTDPIEALRHE